MKIIHISEEGKINLYFKIKESKNKYINKIKLRRVRKEGRSLKFF